MVFKQTLNKGTQRLRQNFPLPKKPVNAVVLFLKKNENSVTQTGKSLYLIYCPKSFTHHASLMVANIPL